MKREIVLAEYYYPKGGIKWLDRGGTTTFQPGDTIIAKDSRVTIRKDPGQPTPSDAEFLYQLVDGSATITPIQVRGEEFVSAIATGVGAPIGVWEGHAMPIFILPGASEGNIGAHFTYLDNDARGRGRPVGNRERREAGEDVQWLDEAVAAALAQVKAVQPLSGGGGASGGGVTDPALLASSYSPTTQAIIIALLAGQDVTKMYSMTQLVDFQREIDALRTNDGDRARIAFLKLKFSDPAMGTIISGGPNLSGISGTGRGAGFTDPSVSGAGSSGRRPHEEIEGDRVFSPEEFEVTCGLEWADPIDQASGLAYRPHGSPSNVRIRMTGLRPGAVYRVDNVHKPSGAVVASATFQANNLGEIDTSAADPVPNAWPAGPYDVLWFDEAGRLVATCQGFLIPADAATGGGGGSGGGSGGGGGGGGGGTGGNGGPGEPPDTGIERSAPVASPALFLIGGGLLLLLALRGKRGG